MGLIVALARPRSAGRAEQSTTEGINIVIAFDISSSMLAEDFPALAEAFTRAGTSVLRGTGEVTVQPSSSHGVNLHISRY